MSKVFLVGKTCLDLTKLHQLMKQAIGVDADFSGRKNTDYDILKNINDNRSQIDKCIFLSICTILDQDTYIEVVDQKILQPFKSPDLIRKFYYFCIFTASKFDWHTFVKSNNSSKNDLLSSFSLEVEELIKNV